MTSTFEYVGDVQAVELPGMGLIEIMPGDVVETANPADVAAMTDSPVWEEA